MTGPGHSRESNPHTAQRLAVPVPQPQVSLPPGQLHPKGRRGRIRLHRGSRGPRSLQKRSQ